MSIFKTSKSKAEIKKPEQVKTVAHLKEYIEFLSRDSLENPDGWKNASIEDYLESISAWIVDADLNHKSSKSLKLSDVAGLFYVGKIFE